MAFVSVVIPVLDDEAELERLLLALGVDERVELIVVEGGRAGERALARPAPHVRWLASPAGRAIQMNLGAAQATGEWLVFLHADTRLPAGWVEEIARAGQDPAVVGGSFRFALASSSNWARLIERGVAFRVRVCRLPYGDQALFVRRQLFAALGGYRELPLMEDVDFVRRLGRRGRLYRSRLPAVTSARKFEADGWIRRSVENVILVLLYLAGVSPGRLRAIYRRGAGRRAPGPRMTMGRDG